MTPPDPARFLPLKPDVFEMLLALSHGRAARVRHTVTNALTPDYLALGYTTSGAEELQQKVPAAKVVKAFNTVFASTMDSGTARGEQISALVAADDDEAKHTAMELASSIGFDAVDAGPLQSARLLEPMALQNILLG